VDERGHMRPLHDSSEKDPHGTLLGIDVKENGLSKSRCTLRSEP
jgi:hypothetical protein